MRALESSHIVVIGGGFVGQLIQLAVPSARLLDWRKDAPLNHLDTRVGPQYLWEPIPGVPSYSFPVTTLVDDKEPTEASILAYKQKIGKQEDGGNWGLQFQHETTGWHSELPVPRVEYDRHVLKVNLYNHELVMTDGAVINWDILLSTIPLDAFLKLCTIPPGVHYPFKSDPIYMSIVNYPREDMNKMAMVLNYISSPDNVFYRQTRTKEQTFWESLLPKDRAVRMVPGKIHPHPESEEVLTKLRIFDAFCFGRYATWRPDELAHETWQRIQEWRQSR